MLRDAFPSQDKVNTDQLRGKIKKQIENSMQRNFTQITESAVGDKNKAKTTFLEKLTLESHSNHNLEPIQSKSYIKQNLPIIIRSPSFSKKVILNGERGGLQDKNQDNSMKLHQNNPDSTKIFENSTYQKTHLTQNQDQNPIRQRKKYFSSPHGVSNQSLSSNLNQSYNFSKGSISTLDAISGGKSKINQNNLTTNNSIPQKINSRRINSQSLHSFASVLQQRKNISTDMHLDRKSQHNDNNDSTIHSTTTTIKHQIPSSSFKMPNSSFFQKSSLTFFANQHKKPTSTNVSFDEIGSIAEFKRVTDSSITFSAKVSTLESLCNLYNNVLEEIFGDTEKIKLFEILNNILETVETTCGNFVFTIENHEMFSEISKDLGDFNKSMSLLQHARLISSMIGRYDIKQRLYRKIADNLSETGCYNKSLVYLKKMLRLAWKMRDEDSEIDIYDLMGKALVQIGEVDLSDFFHQRSMLNEREPLNSNLRIASNNQLMGILIGKKAFQLPGLCLYLSHIKMDYLFVIFFPFIIFYLGEMGVKIQVKNTDLQSLNAHSRVLHDYESGSDDDMDLRTFQKAESQDSNKKNSKPILTPFIAFPRVITDYGKKKQILGRPNVASYLRDDGIIKVSQRMSHLSQNRDLKNFYIYAYKNSAFWVKEEGNQMEKYLLLKKNLNKHKNRILKCQRVAREMLGKQIKEEIELVQKKEKEEIEQKRKQIDSMGEQ